MCPPPARVQAMSIFLSRAGELVLIEDRADRNALRDEITFVEPAARETLNLREEVPASGNRPRPGSSCREGAWRG